MPINYPHPHYRLPPSPHIPRAHEASPPHAHSRPASPAHTPLLWPLRNLPRVAHSFDNLVEIRLDDAPADDHLLERCVQRLKVEDEVELADVLEEGVERLHKHLD